jgi:Tol biopolymer transport system component
MRVPIGGGTPEEVPVGGRLDELRCSLLATGRCVLRTTISHESYVFYELDPLHGKGQEVARTEWIPSITEDWDLSPDGTQLALPIRDSQEAHIRVIDLQTSSAKMAEREVALAGITDLISVVWSATGHGWFITADMPIGTRLFYVYPNGSYLPLDDISGWAVPSPDGHHVAFVNSIVSSNAWLIERH